MAEGPTNNVGNLSEGTFLRRNPKPRHFHSHLQSLGRHRCPEKMLKSSRSLARPTTDFEIGICVSGLIYRQKTASEFPEFAAAFMHVETGLIAPGANFPARLVDSGFSTNLDIFQFLAVFVGRCAYLYTERKFYSNQS